MVTQQRIYHWKHGWIPLDHYAVVEKAHGREVAPTASVLARAKARQQKFRDAAQQKIRLAPDVKSQQQGSWRLTQVNGYPDVQFQEPLEVDRRPPEQYREVARAATEVLKRYPRAEREPLVIGFSNALEPSVMGETKSAKPHYIRLNTEMWDNPTLTLMQMQRMQENHFGLTAQASDLQQFRANVLTHEIGHVLHGRDLDEVNQAPLSKMDQFGLIEEFATEQVTPRQMGFSPMPKGSSMPADYPDVDASVPRWQADSLDRRSAYATLNQFEFFAEAFLDGTINGDQASESGKRAVQIAGKLFGPGSPSVRDRLYEGGAS